MHVETAPRRAKIGTFALWAVTALAGLMLAYKRYTAATAGPPPDFVTYFLPAAAAVAAGQSPYSVPGYFYTPLLALILAPFAAWPHAAAAWTALMVGAGLVACPLAVWACGRGLASWQKALLTTTALVTLFYSWTATVDLFFGTPNMLVVLSLAAAVFLTTRQRPLGTGLALGVAALVKTWPGAFALWLLRRPLRPRLREWTGMAILAASAFVLALLVGGLPAVLTMVSAPFVNTQQPVRAFSAWGIPKLLFSETGLAVPVVVSPILQWVTTSVLLAWGAALLITALRHPGDDMVSLYNIVFAVLILLPVSHSTYQLLPLPALWWWLAEAFRDPRAVRPWLVSAVLVLWWLLVFREGLLWPEDSYLAFFSSVLAAATASILGAAWPSVRLKGTSRV